MSKVWYTLHNTKDFDHLLGLVWIQPSTLCSFENSIQASIDSFNSNHEWDEMWDIKEAKVRLDNGHNLFIGVDQDGPLAHVWFDKDYLYNIYINPRRKEGYGVKFIEGCLNFIEHDYIKLYCDSWNIRAQKFFSKIGTRDDN